MHRTAVVICDMWDKHWCLSMTQRIAGLAVAINDFAEAMRSAGAFILHAPSAVVGFYSGTDRGGLAKVQREEPPLPISPVEMPISVLGDMGCPDTPLCKYSLPMRRQHPAIRVDPTDGVSDDASEIYPFFKQLGIERVVFTGVHANMCLIDRDFGLRAMVGWGMDVALMEDLTQIAYRPRTMEEAEKLVYKTISASICPVWESEDWKFNNE